MSRHTRKPTICICEKKDADQLCSNCTADQRLCFRYTDGKIPLLFKSAISSFYPACVTVRFVQDLVRNPNFWVFHAKAHMIKVTRKCVYETLCPQLVSHFQDVKMSKK